MDTTHRISNQYHFPIRAVAASVHPPVRAHRGLLGGVDELGFSCRWHAHHRQTKATLIYRRTKHLRAVQRLLGHAKLGSTVRYLGIEVDDALGIAEQTAG